MKALILIVLATFVGVLLVFYDSFLLFLFGMILIFVGYYLPMQSDLIINSDLTSKRLNQNFNLRNKMYLKSLGVDEEPEEREWMYHDTEKDGISIDPKLTIVIIGFAYICIAFIYWMIFP